MRVSYSVWDFSQKELRQPVAHVLASDPASPVAGQWWYRSDLGTWMFRAAAATVQLGRLDQISSPTAALNMNSQQIQNVLDPTGAQHAATQNYVLTRTINSFAAPTADFSMNSHRITGALDGVAATDLATVQQVTAAAAGIAAKDEVDLATNAALPANTYANGASGVGATLTATANAALTVDGVAVAVGQRILVKNEVAAANNGLYVVTATGSGAAAYVLTRATDADSPTDLQGMYAFINQGTANSSSGWLLTTPATGMVIGTTGLTFAKFAQATLGNRGFAATGPTGAGATSWVVAHNLGTVDVIVMIKDISTLREVEFGVTVTDANNVTIDADGAVITQNGFRAVVIPVA